MKRKILSLTGTRADYGLMAPVFKEIFNNSTLQLDLIVTGMHLLPDFESSLVKVIEDKFGTLHYISMMNDLNSRKSMAQSFGLAAFEIASVIEKVNPDIVLLQGDRAEMLSAAAAAAQMNIPIVHMSGGDYSGSIDDSIRNAISKLAHIHLTTCRLSTERLAKMGEMPNRIFEVGEPGLDVIRNLNYIHPVDLAREFGLDLDQPIILATQHPVTTESHMAAWQMTQTLEALDELKMQTIITYPNTDSGGKEMIEVLQKYLDRPLFRIIPNLGSVKYLSLMKIASVLVGNSSSGIIEAPSFKLPVVNVGTRQYGRLKACNVIDSGYDKENIVKAICFALEDDTFKSALERECINPYGDGRTSQRTVTLLSGLKLGPSLINKWIIDENECFV